VAGLRTGVVPHEQALARAKQEAKDYEREEKKRMLNELNVQAAELAARIARIQRDLSIDEQAPAVNHNATVNPLQFLSDQAARSPVLPVGTARLHSDNNSPMDNSDADSRKKVKVSDNNSNNNNNNRF
jgi:hypothetical protein